MYVEVLLLVYVGPSHIRPIALFYFYGDSLGGVAGKIQVRTKQVPITEPVWRIDYKSNLYVECVLLQLCRVLSRNVLVDVRLRYLSRS